MGDSFALSKIELSPPPHQLVLRNDDRINCCVDEESFSPATVVQLFHPVPSDILGNIIRPPVRCVDHYFLGAAEDDVNFLKFELAAVFLSLLCDFVGAVAGGGAEDPATVIGRNLVHRVSSRASKYSCRLLLASGFIAWLSSDVLDRSAFGLLVVCVASLLWLHPAACHHASLVFFDAASGNHEKLGCFVVQPDVVTTHDQHTNDFFEPRIRLSFAFSDKLKLDFPLDYRRCLGSCSSLPHVFPVVEEQFHVAFCCFREKTGVLRAQVVFIPESRFGDRPELRPWVYCSSRRNCSCCGVFLAQLEKRERVAPPARQSRGCASLVLPRSHCAANLFLKLEEAASVLDRLGSSGIRWHEYASDATFLWVWAMRSLPQPEYFLAFLGLVLFV
mmetsp:Transcript_6662/g.16337  ORF Transcript_6662/g.16337 Transcript_6662/m.16337 type:complete len:389 (-) Transcript_6662:2652-3818(-)